MRGKGRGEIPEYTDHLNGNSEYDESHQPSEI